MELRVGMSYLADSSFHVRKLTLVKGATCASARELVMRAWNAPVPPLLRQRARQLIFLAEGSGTFFVQQKLFIIKT